MKPVAFDYVRPASVGEACGLLAADGGARVIAGGQTLIPMLAMRLARPTRLVDIARIADLACIGDGTDTVTIGAVTRQAVAEADPVVAGKLPLLAKALPERKERQTQCADHHRAGCIGHHRVSRRGILPRSDDHGGA